LKVKYFCARFERLKKFGFFALRDRLILFSFEVVHFLGISLIITSYFNFRNSLNYGGEDMDFTEAAIDIMEGIDVRQILGFAAEDYMPPSQNPQGNF